MIAVTERLESRRLFAGNVTVTADATFTATLVGDSKSNLVAVTVEEDGSGYRVTGLRGTKVNGAAAATITTASALHFAVSLGKGNDSISFVGALNTQKLSIFAGDGNDRVFLSGTTHVGNLGIDAGKGNDSIALDRVRVTGDLFIDAGKNNDTLTMTNGVTVEGSATLNGGKNKNTFNGVDQLHVNGSGSITSFTTPKKHHDDDDDDDKDDDDKGKHGDD